MELELPPVYSPNSLDEALELLRDAPGPALPIRDPETGEVVAILSRPEAFPPPPAPRLGGMATPLGVYLTDGVVSGGAGPLGLYLTGIVLGLLALVAQAGVHGLLTLTRASRFGPVSSAENWLSLPLIFVLLRLIPMSGTHAAEHQVVHCVERGTPLTPDCVRAMPRVHPRCGTNLCVGLALFLLVFVGAFGAAHADGLSVANSATVALLAAAPPALLLWRWVGAFVQQWFATRPATDRQIAGAIRAAHEVLMRHQEDSVIRFRPLRRVWSMGFVQVLLGYATLYVPLFLVLQHWPALADRLGM